MRGKNLIWIWLLAMLALSLSPSGIMNAKAPPATKIYVDPSNSGNVWPGTILTVDIRVDNVVGLFSYGFTLKWDPYVVYPIPVGYATEGPFLSLNGAQATNFVSAVSAFSDSISVADAITAYPYTTVSGSGVLATLKLKAVGFGSTALALTDVKLRDEDLQPMSASAFNGKVTVHIVAEVTSRDVEHTHFNVTQELMLGEDRRNELYATIKNQLTGPNEFTATGDVWVRAVFIGWTPAGVGIRLRSPLTGTLVAPGAEATVFARFDGHSYRGPWKYQFNQIYSEYSYPDPLTGLPTTWYSGTQWKHLFFFVDYPGLHDVDPIDIWPTDWPPEWPPSWPMDVTIGDPVHFDVLVYNRGDFTEEVTLDVYYAEPASYDPSTGGFIGTQTMTMGPRSFEVFSFTWDTTGAPAGVWSLYGLVNPVPWEAVAGDNEIDFTDWYGMALTLSP